MKLAAASQALTPGSFLKAAQTNITASMPRNYCLNLLKGCSHRLLKAGNHRFMPQHNRGADPQVVTIGGLLSQQAFELPSYQFEWHPIRHGASLRTPRSESTDCEQL
jgi:hypothetical protein